MFACGGGFDQTGHLEFSKLTLNTTNIQMFSEEFVENGFIYRKQREFSDVIASYLRGRTTLVKHTKSLRQSVITSYGRNNR